MNPPPKRIQALLLDWAGTTIDFGSRAPAEVFAEIFRRRGIEITEAEARGPMGMAKREHIAAVLAVPRIATLWQERFGRAGTDEDVQALYDDFLPLQKEVLARFVELIPGVHEMTAACRAAGVRIGSTTGYTRALMEIVAPLAAAQGYKPEVIVCADDVPRGRPAPWMLLRAAEALDVFPLETIAVVDDTPVGIQAGRAAGMVCIALAGSGNALGLSRAEYEALTPPEREARLAPIRREFQRLGAHYVLDTLADLPPLLAELTRG